MKKFLLVIMLLTLMLSGCNVIVSSSQTPASHSPTVEVFPSESTGTATEAPTATQAESAARMIVYIGRDGNLWRVNSSTLEREQLTADAAGFSTNNTTDVVEYRSPAWSSDGRFLVVERSLGIPNSSGYDFSYALMVYDSENGEIRVLMDKGQTLGYSWKPGTHLLAYTLAVPNDYWVARGQVDTALLSGVWTVDAYTGETAELVKPEAGYSLSDPTWSPNGQIISFEEVLYMEGRGPFAYYDFAAQKYVRWEKPIGSVSWSPDGSQLLHDNLNYAPAYDERIFLTNRDRSSEIQLSPDVQVGYAYDPLFSPSGKQLVYIAVQGYDPDLTARVMVQDLPDGQPRELTSLSQIYGLSWTPDGQGLLYAAGNYPDTKVTLLSIIDGTTHELGDGWQAVMQP